MIKMIMIKKIKIIFKKLLLYHLELDKIKKLGKYNKIWTT